MRTARLIEVMTLSQQLSHEEKLRLIEYVAHDLQCTSPLPRLSWHEARGLGKGVWRDVDVERYIDTLRHEWDR
jgi:hypothetical protein